MELTDAQKKTIEYFGLEVVETPVIKYGEHMLSDSGDIFWQESTTTEALVTGGVVVRPALAARVKELEGRLRSFDEHNHKLVLQVADLEDQLAPIRALKVGSWQWAMVQFLLGRQVVDRHGTKYRFDVRNADHTEPFRLLTEPPPAPTADVLADAIDAYRKTDVATQEEANARHEMFRVAAAYRAANAKGGV